MIDLKCGEPVHQQAVLSSSITQREKKSIYSVVRRSMDREMRSIYSAVNQFINRQFHRRLSIDREKRTIYSLVRRSIEKMKSIYCAVRRSLVSSLVIKGSSS